MLPFLTVLGIVLGACVFVAMAAAPHCEPEALKTANDAEREALRREAEHYRVCLDCNAERDNAECARCGEQLAAKYSRRAAR